MRTTKTLLLFGLLAASTFALADIGDLRSIRQSRGDLNQDGTLDGWDLELLTDYLNGSPKHPRTSFQAMDVNLDGKHNLADAVKLLNALFTSGGAFACPDSADANDDGVINLSDALTVLNYLFLGQNRIAPPVDEPGQDPTEDNMFCD